MSDYTDLIFEAAELQLIANVTSMSILERQAFLRELEQIQYADPHALSFDVGGFTLNGQQMSAMRLEVAESITEIARDILIEDADDYAADMNPEQDPRQPWQKEVERLSAELQQDPGNEDLYEDLKRWQAVGKNTAQLIQDHHQSKLDQESLNADNLIAQQIGLGDFDDAA